MKDLLFTVLLACTTVLCLRLAVVVARLKTEQFRLARRVEELEDEANPYLSDAMQLGSKVGNWMRAAYYADNQLAFERALLEVGYCLGENQKKEVTLLGDIKPQLGTAILRAHFRYERPLIPTEELERLISRDREDGNAEKWVDCMVAALRHQKRYVMRVATSAVADAYEQLDELLIGNEVG